MRCRIAAWAACSLLVAYAVSACGGSSGNGVASKSPDAILAAALAAVDGAKFVHISGKFANGASPTTLNLDLVSGKGGHGNASVGGLAYRIVVIDNTVYVNARSAFWRHVVSAATATALDGRWLKAPASGRFALLAKLTNLRALLPTVLSTHGTLVKSGTTNVNGQSAIGLREAAGVDTIYVATTGKPYLLEIVQRGSQAGRIVLDHFDQSVSLSPPANAIDISKFK